MTSRVQRTYSRRSKSTLSSSSPPPEDSAPEPPTSSPSSTPPSSPIPKRPLSEVLSFRPPAKKPRLSQPDAKKIKSSSSSSTKWKSNPKKQSLIQLHFSIDASILRRCPICDLSYTKGAQDDEALHKSHCARVQRGLEWTKDEIKESAKHGVVEIESGIRLKDGSIGRILSVNANIPGRIGSKVRLYFNPLSPQYSSPICILPYVKKHKNNQLTALFETINLAISSPPLSRQTLANSKAYLFLLIPAASDPTKFTVGSRAHQPNSRQREKIVGCVIAEPIATAMCIIENADIRHRALEDKTVFGGTEAHRNHVGRTLAHQNSSSLRPPAADTPPERDQEDLVTVDVSTSLYCSPEPLPTPLGISRIFVSSSYRRLGVASRLLTAAAENFIHGIALDPAKGEVAFTQPTASGKVLMEKWGKKGARIYRE